MAKSFYTPEETSAKLGLTAEQVKDLVRNGKLREYRDAGKSIYKTADIDALVKSLSAAKPAADKAGSALGGSVSDVDMLGTAELTLDESAGDRSGGLRLAPDEEAAKPPKPPAKAAKPPAPTTDAVSFELEDTGGVDAMTTGDLVLEPVDQDGSGIQMASRAGTDAVRLDDTTDTKSEENDKERTSVSSIGVSVFEEDEIEQEADPLAQTVVSGGPGEALGIDGVGSGSGLLDLTRESDDTSLGAELLDEITHPGEEGEEMGEATRAGIEDAIPEEAGAARGGVAETAERVVAGQTMVVTRVEYAPDALGTGLTGLLFAGVLIMCVAGLAAASATQDVWPGILDTMYRNNWIVGLAGLAVAGLGLGIGFVLGKKAGK